MEDVGLFIFIVLAFIFSFALGVGLANDEIIKQCEKNLPRDQHCKVIAVPEESK